jgi:hypothetical protein
MSRFKDSVKRNGTQQRPPSTPCEPFLNRGAVQLTAREKVVTRETRRCHGNANNLLYGLSRHAFARMAECTDARGPAASLSRRHFVVAVLLYAGGNNVDSSNLSVIAWVVESSFIE